MKDWHDILRTCELQNWKEALAAVVTYAQPEEFSSLCGRLKALKSVTGHKSKLIHQSALLVCVSDLLGGRLEAADSVQLRAQACLCYICAGNIEKLVSCWSRAKDGHCPLSLQAGLHTHSRSKGNMIPRSCRGP